jgi:hypothetical protein
VASPTVEQTHREYDAEELASVNASEDQWMDELEQAANAQSNRCLTRWKETADGGI